MTAAHRLPAHAALVLALGLWLAWAPLAASEEGRDLAEPPCAASSQFHWLGDPLTRTARRLAQGEGVTVVAIGSSSTAGAGASSKAHCYPSRLEVELKDRFPDQRVIVRNRGVNGEDAAQMIARFERDVLPEKPDLVVWQIGTNAVLRDHVVDDEAPLIRDGIRRLKAMGAEVIIVNPQFAPRVLEKFDVFRMIDLIGAAAKAEGAGLFQRFALMRYWVENERMAFEEFTSPDGLHMNDWSYACVAKTLAEAIAAAVARAGISSESSAVRRARPSR